MYQVTEEQKSALESANERASKGTFSSPNFGEGAILDPATLTFQTGDVFQVPETFDNIRCSLIGNNKAYFIMVVTQNNEARRLYPTVFMRRRMVYNQDGTATNQWATTEGSAATLFKSKYTINEGMDALKGKTIKVSGIQMVNTLRPNTTILRSEPIYTFDLVEDAK